MRNTSTPPQLVVEGKGIILLKRLNQEFVEIVDFSEGKQISFEPGEEHCLIGLSNMVVFEESNDPLGMDMDLIFIYLPE